jgi:hypothetical protein
MITRPEYQDTLFLFNDNQEQFVAFLNYLRQPYNRALAAQACTAGGGNAVIRPYQCKQPPRAAGIPTGRAGHGYQYLPEALPYLQLAAQRIQALLATGRYRYLAYSAAADGYSLGTTIFAPSPAVKDYIVQLIYYCAQWANQQANYGRY